MDLQLVNNGTCFESLPIEIQQHIFSYCGSKTRREIMLVCKDWAKKLLYFQEDFQVHLSHCCIREKHEPVSLLMNSTRPCHSLCLGQDIHTESTAVQKRFFAHLGKDIQELDIRLLDKKFLEVPDFLLFFVQLKKLTVTKFDCLRSFECFPETLEHLHLEQLSVMEKTQHLTFLRKIKNLKVLTSNTIQLKGGLEALVAMSFRLGTFGTRMFTLDENLKFVLEYMQSLEYIYLKCNTNFIGTPTITLDDVFGIKFYRAPTTFLQFNEFPHLRSIHISWGPDQNPAPFCFNFHQAALCPGVTELEVVDNIQQSCIGCFRSLIDSFPNLRKIALVNCNITNQNVKYICYKFPKLNHLETDSKDLNHEIICYDQPEYLLGNLMHLETLRLPNFIADTKLFQLPFMPHLKKVQFGVVPDDCVLINFSEKTPKLEYFRIGYGSQLTDDGIRELAQNWPYLRTLRLHSTTPCDISAIKQFCRKLRTLELFMEFSSMYTYTSFFNEISTLRKLVHENQTTYRYEVYWDGATKWDE